MQGAGGDQPGAQAVVLGVAAVAPVDVLGFGQGRHVAYPFDQLAMTDGGRRVDRRSVRERSVHGGSSTQRGNSGRGFTGRHGGSGESGRVERMGQASRSGGLTALGTWRTLPGSAPGSGGSVAAGQTHLGAARRLRRRNNRPMLRRRLLAAGLALVAAGGAGAEVRGHRAAPARCRPCPDRVAPRAQPAEGVQRRYRHRRQAGRRTGPGGARGDQGGRARRRPHQRPGGRGRARQADPGARPAGDRRRRLPDRRAGAARPGKERPRRPAAARSRC